MQHIENKKKNGHTEYAVEKRKFDNRYLYVIVPNASVEIQKNKKLKYIYKIYTYIL